MNKIILIITSLIISSTATPSMAYEHSNMNGHQMKKHAHHMTSHDYRGMKNIQMDKPSKIFLVKKEVDGYEVTFHVMPAAANMKHGGSHNLMVKIKKNGKVISDILINSKVFFPNKTSDSKMMIKMNGWFMNGYDIGKGTHGIMILFKTPDGKKHKASVHYPKDKSS